MNAASVSRHLRSLGFSPVAPSDHNRQGLKVRASASGRVRVVADLNSERAAQTLAMEARDALREAGYRFDDRGDTGEPAFYVTGRER
jgi:hypothetical protein